APDDLSVGNRRSIRSRSLRLRLKRWTLQAGLEKTGICNHTVRGTGITAYLENPEAKLEHAQQMAAHSDPKTTRLYDRRSDKVSLDEVERIGI
ncbi:integrase, partial [Lamprobacter modestohalophilus]|nr:integrase [Lamprobacter modestohalophilus]